jgi:hypothetical protein
VVVKVDVEFVGRWNALKKYFQGRLEVTAQKILEEHGSPSLALRESASHAPRRSDKLRTRRSLSGATRQQGKTAFRATLAPLMVEQCSRGDRRNNACDWLFDWLCLGSTASWRRDKNC